MENNNHMTTQVFLMLDMTSSMQANKQATMDACNEFVEGLKADHHTEVSPFRTESTAATSDQKLAAGYF